MEVTNSNFTGTKISEVEIKKKKLASSFFVNPQFFSQKHVVNSIVMLSTPLVVIFSATNKNTESRYIGFEPTTSDFRDSHSIKKKS